MTSRSPFRAAFERHLRRRRLAAGLEGARRGGRRALAAAVALLLLAVLGVLPPPAGPSAALAGLAALLAGGAVVGAAVAVRREARPEILARALDAALGGEDLVVTAAAVDGRRTAPGRFAVAVLDRAAEEVARLPDEDAGPLPRPPWRLLGLAALVALLVSLLPPRGFGLLPGLGSGWGSGGWPADGRPAWGPAKEREGGRPRAEEGAKDRDPRDPEARPHESGSPDVAADPVATLELAALSRTYGPSGPVTVGVVVEGGRGAGEGRDLGLLLSVEGGSPVPEAAPRRLASGQRDARALDLRSIPGLRDALGPGRHRVAGELRDGAGRAVARSKEIEIVVEGGGEEEAQGGGGGPKPPPPAPQPNPAAPAPPEASASPGGNRPPPPPPKIDLPPTDFQRRLVHPLFGEGAEVEKRGPVLVLDPDGSRGDPPRALEPGEVVREVRARAEAAARREGVDPRDVETVRRYFEALRRLVEGKE